MPELPDITIYLEALNARVTGQTLEGIRLNNPFLLRTVEPPVEQLVGQKVLSVRRLGKRVVLGLEDDLWIVIHLMIAGRLHWKTLGAKFPGKIGLAAFDFSSGTLLLTEAGSKRRASLHLLAGESELAKLDPGGIDPLVASMIELF